MLDHLFEGLCCLVAYFVFSDSTLRYLDKQSTATSRYFTPQFYFVNLSTYARSTSQISFIALTTTLSLGNPRRRERYLVKDGFVYRYIFSSIFYSNFAVSLRFQMTEGRLNSACQVSTHRQKNPSLSYAFFPLSFRYFHLCSLLCIFFFWFRSYSFLLIFFVFCFGCFDTVVFHLQN